MSTRPSPLQNRVTPFGEIVASPARGHMMGNRGGRLHEGWQIKRRQASRQWIICVTAFRGRARKVMESGYTELFFLDEATALAAGHRPCFECRKKAAKVFRDAFGATYAHEIDRRLNTERRGARPQADLNLPSGAMVASGDQAYLVSGGRYRRWSPTGYGPAEDTPADLRLLTPVSTVAALRAGYQPVLHPSAL